MLHEDVQSARARRIPIQLPCAYRIDRGTAFEQLEAVRRNEQGLARHIDPVIGAAYALQQAGRSEEHTSELQSLMRISYAVFCLKKQNLAAISRTKHLYVVPHS